MDTNNQAQQINQLSDSEKFKYIMALSDESTKLSLLRFLNSDYYKEKIINTFSNDQVKLEGIKQLQ